MIRRSSLKKIGEFTLNSSYRWADIHPRRWSIHTRNNQATYRAYTQGKKQPTDGAWIEVTKQTTDRVCIQVYQQLMKQYNIGYNP